MDDYTAGSAILDELSEFTGLMKRANEKMDRFMRRILGAYDGMPDEDVDSLSEETWEWCEAAMKAKNRGAEIPLPGDYVDDALAKEPVEPEVVEEDEETEEPEEALEVEEDEPQEEEEEPSTMDELEAMVEQARAEEDAALAANPEPKPGAPKPRTPGSPSRKARGPADRTVRFRRLLLENWNTDRAILMDLQAQQQIGLSEGTMNGIIYHTRQTVELLEELGLDTSVLARA